MYNFGDEFTIESYRIPWLVWIQVMVMVLLLILLYCFSLLVIYLSNDDITTTTSRFSLCLTDVASATKIGGSTFTFSGLSSNQSSTQFHHVR
ncbi:hypothetical protein ACFX13_048020 [Malus domestica]